MQQCGYSRDRKPEGKKNRYQYSELFYIYSGALVRVFFLSQKASAYFKNLKRYYQCFQCTQIDKTFLERFQFYIDSKRKPLCFGIIFTSLQFDIVYVEKRGITDVIGHVLLKI